MKIKHTGVAVGLLLLLIFVYWPGIVGESAMKWDATAIYLPWKLFLCSSVFSGSLPLWNPFISGGFPQCIDPGTWYPISYIFGWGGVYDLHSLLYEYLFHVWLSALGFYFILIILSIDWRIAAVLSTAFLFNGFFVGNAQHLGWIVATTWIIWAIYFFIGLINSTIQSSYLTINLRHGLGLGFSMYLLFTGGYPGMFVFQFYVLLGWSLIYWIHRKIQSEFSWSSFKNWLIVMLFAVLVFITISIPVWLSLFKYLPNLSRGNGLESSELMFGSFPLTKSIEFLLPRFLISSLKLTSNSENSWDISMTNGYWGVLLGWCLLVFLLISKHRYVALSWFGAGLFCWLLSMGADLPFKNFANKVLPGMEYFRFPSQIRFWGIFFWLIAVAAALSVFYKRVPQWLIYTGCLLVVSESVWQGLSGRYVTVLAGIEEYVTASEINKVNARLRVLGGTSISQNQLDTVWVRPLDGPKIEPFGFLWYNKGVLLNRFAEDGYNPYSFNIDEGVGDWVYNKANQKVQKADSIAAKSKADSMLSKSTDDLMSEENNISNGQHIQSIRESTDLHRLIHVVGGNWVLVGGELINNNTIEIAVRRVGKRDTGASYLVVNQTGLPGWNVSRSNNSSTQSLSSANGQLNSRVQRRLVVPLNGGLTENDNLLRLSFNPVFTLLGYCVYLSTLFWVSIIFIVFWLGIAVYLNIRISYAYFQ
jgi:hypothetical protein